MAGLTVAKRGLTTDGNWEFALINLAEPRVRFLFLDQARP